MEPPSEFWDWVVLDCAPFIFASVKLLILAKCFTIFVGGSWKTYVGFGLILLLGYILIQRPPNEPPLVKTVICIAPPEYSFTFVDIVECNSTICTSSDAEEAAHKLSDSAKQKFIMEYEKWRGKAKKNLVEQRLIEGAPQLGLTVQDEFSAGFLYGMKKLQVHVAFIGKGMDTMANLKDTEIDLVKQYILLVITRTWQEKVTELLQEIRRDPELEDIMRNFKGGKY